MRTRGFTLIELMISMALFGLIAAGAMSLVVSGARMQSHSARVDVAQASLRTAIDFITRDVMTASTCNSSGIVTLSASTAPSIDFTAVNNNITSGSPVAANTDRLDFYSVDGTTMGQVAIAPVAGATSLVTTMESNVNLNITFIKQTTPYVSYLQVCDLTNAAVVQLINVSGAPPTVTLTTAALPSSFAANAYVMPSRHISYFVSDKQFTSANAALQNTSMLMMQINNNTAQPLAEGVEDMQIAYGFDTNGDGILFDNSSTTDEWLYNVAGDTITGTMTVANLRAIRITLVVKSTSVDSGQTNFPVRPAAEDRAAAAGTDGFIRRVLRTEIAVRNLNLNL